MNGHFGNCLKHLTTTGITDILIVFSGETPMTTEQFYSLWEKFAFSDIADQLPEDVEKLCEELEITVDYYIEEFL